LAEVDEQVILLNDSLKKCETAAREKTLEHRISEKQNLQMIKQLQNQLKIYTGSPVDSPLDCMAYFPLFNLFLTISEKRIFCG
jgi:hypothetical protein